MGAALAVLKRVVRVEQVTLSAEVAQREPGGGETYALHVDLSFIGKLLLIRLPTFQQPIHYRRSFKRILPLAIACASWLQQMNHSCREPEMDRVSAWGSYVDGSRRWEGECGDALLQHLLPYLN